MEHNFTCADCTVKACRGNGNEFPPFCTANALAPELLAEAEHLLLTEENETAVASARNEYEGYCKRTRVEEIMHYAQLMGWKKIGVAFCVGLSNEARAFVRVLRAHGYDVSAVACKCGALDKTSIGVPEECTKIGKKLCNPILQALALNSMQTELNVALGLCVGHDSLFYKYSAAPVTTLAAKDRVLGHNPVVPLNLLDGYWKKLLEKDPYLDAEG